MIHGLRVFVTGGAGVIGTELVGILVADGFDVTVGDLKPKPPQIPEEVRYLSMDLNNLTAEELQSLRPDLLIHLAATFERSSESPSFWNENFNHNVRLSHHIMTIAQTLPSLRRVVFASSYLVYDPELYLSASPPTSPTRLTEAHRLHPRNLTGMSKLAHEKELEFLSHQEGLRFTSVSARIFRGYGRNSRDVISRWIRALLRGQEIAVYLPEGRFDYVYAEDSATGLVELALREEVTGPVNLATGVSRTVGEVLAILREHFPGARIREEQASIPFESSEADTTLITGRTSWAPHFDLELGIEKVIEYERGRV